jgi:hypothetical protein
MASLPPNHHPDSPLLSDPLFQQAFHAAQEKVQSWIRAVLREVALQSLKQSGTALDEQTVPRAQAACEQVAKRWGERLIAVGHHRVAQQIQHIVATEGKTLYHHCPSAPPPAAIIEVVAPPAGTVVSNRPAKTALGRLHQLGKLSKDTTSMTQQIDSWGVQGQTDWPYDWGIIQKAAQEIPDRLHRAKSDKVVVRIPKTLWERQQADDNDEENEEEVDNNHPSIAGETKITPELSSQEDHKRQAIQLLLKRKRKNAPRGQQPSKRQALPKAAPIPRPPSEHPERAELSFRDGWTEAERQRLDAYVHNDDDDKPRMLLLGALSDLGRFHHFLQKSAATKTKTNKQQRRWQQFCVKERLGDHQEVDTAMSDGRRKRSSRVTATAAADHCYWYDLDLSQCLLECRKRNSSTADDNTIREERFLLDFSHLEVMLLDEDSSAISRDEEGNVQPNANDSMNFL